MQQSDGNVQQTCNSGQLVDQRKATRPSSMNQIGRLLAQFVNSCGLTHSETSAREVFAPVIQSTVRESSEREKHPNEDSHPQERTYQQTDDKQTTLNEVHGRQIANDSKLVPGVKRNYENKLIFPGQTSGWNETKTDEVNVFTNKSDSENQLTAGLDFHHGNEIASVNDRQPMEIEDPSETYALPDENDRIEMTTENASHPESERTVQNKKISEIEYHSSSDDDQLDSEVESDTTTDDATMSENDDGSILKLRDDEKDGEDTEFDSEDGNVSDDEAESSNESEEGVVTADESSSEEETESDDDDDDTEDSGENDGCSETEMEDDGNFEYAVNIAIQFSDNPGNSGRNRIVIQNEDSGGSGGLEDVLLDLLDNESPRNVDTPFLNLAQLDSDSHESTPDETSDVKSPSTNPTNAETPFSTSGRSAVGTDDKKGPPNKIRRVDDPYKIQELSSAVESSSMMASPNESHSCIRCSVCLNSGPKLKSRLCATICGHVFCRSCARKFMRMKPQCPICRKKLDGNSIHKIFF